MESITTSYELFLEKLNEMYNGEQQIAAALPSIISQVQNLEMREALEEHLEETKEQIERLKESFELLTEKKSETQCKVVQLILTENDRMLSRVDSRLLDLAIATGCEVIERFEQATYDTLYHVAKSLDHLAVADLLKETLNEEEKAASTLSKIAKGLMTEVPTGFSEE